VIFFFCDSDVVLLWIGSCKNILKTPYCACLLPRKLAIETVMNFASADMLTLQQNICRFPKQDASFQTTIAMFLHHKIWLYFPTKLISISYKQNKGCKQLGSRPCRSIMGGCHVRGGEWGGRLGPSYFRDTAGLSFKHFALLFFIILLKSWWTTLESRLTRSEASHAFFSNKAKVMRNAFHNEAKVIGKCAKEPLNNFIA